MDYFLLIVCAFLFSGQIIFSKLFENKCGNKVSDSICFTVISSIFSVIVVFCVNGFTLRFNTFSIIMATLLAFVSCGQNIFGIKATACGPVSIYTLFMMLGGMILPLIVGVVFLNESMSAWVITATVILTIALFMPLFDKNQTDKKNYSKVLFVILCVIVFILNGANSVIGKLHQINENAVTESDFLLTEYIIKTIISLVILFCRKDKPKYSLFKDKYCLVSSIGYVAVHVSASLILLYCAKTVNASFMYPLVTGGTLVFTPFITLILFKEKISRLTAIEIAISVLATVLFVL